MRKKVVFISSVFEEVQTGPAIYARYLWNAFRDDRAIEFHLVSPTIKDGHSQLHASGVGSSSLDTYRLMQSCGLELAKSLGPDTIVHGNAAHSMSMFGNYQGDLLVQVNDYVAAEIWSKPIRTLRHHGLRRLLSLIWRHVHERKIVRGAAVVICNSDYTKSVLVDRYSLPPSSRLRTIYKAVDLSDFVPVERRIDPYPDRLSQFRVVFVGTDWRTKGLECLLRAINSIRADIPSVHLTVAGPSNTENIRAIGRLIKDIGIDGHVLLPGRIGRRDLVGLLQHSDLFVLPSFEEALGVSILEAMAAGAPVIASRVGGIPEIIVDQQNGLLFDTGDWCQLREKMSQIYSDKGLASRLVRAGHETVRDFGVDRMIDEIRALYLDDRATTPSETA